MTSRAVDRGKIAENKSDYYRPEITCTRIMAFGMNIVDQLFAGHEAWEQRVRRKPLTPQREGDRARCGAYARSTGKSCKARALANGRCRNHGGMSTGPKTPEGKARSLTNLKQFRS